MDVSSHPRPVVTRLLPVLAVVTAVVTVGLAAELIRLSMLRPSWSSSVRMPVSSLLVVQGDVVTGFYPGAYGSLTSRVDFVGRSPSAPAPLVADPACPQAPTEGPR